MLGTNQNHVNLRASPIRKKLLDPGQRPEAKFSLALSEPLALEMLAQLRDSAEVREQLLADGVDFLN